MKYMTKAIRYSANYVQKVMNNNMTLAEAFGLFFIINAIVYLIINCVR